MFTRILTLVVLDSLALFPHQTLFELPPKLCLALICKLVSLLASARSLNIRYLLGTSILQYGFALLQLLGTSSYEGFTIRDSIAIPGMTSADVSDQLFGIEGTHLEADMVLPPLSSRIGKLGAALFEGESWMARVGALGKDSELI